MKSITRSTHTYAKGLEQLRISELLLEEAVAKQQKRESIEALELREEALAYQTEGVALLDAAMHEQRDLPESLNEKSRARGNGF